jgi:hypothetical protein
MNALGAATIATVVAMFGSAKTAYSIEIPKVIVCLNPAADTAVLQARLIASELFARAGVRIDWRREIRPCATSENSITVILWYTTPADRLPGALAYTTPYQGNRIVVFYDRIVQRKPQVQVQSLLGHVLAHEIAHALQGLSRHSSSGIMKANWSSRDYSDMRRNSFGFSLEDIDLIQLGLANRRSRSEPGSNSSKIVSITSAVQP